MPGMTSQQQDELEQAGDAESRLLTMLCSMVRCFMAKTMMSNASCRQLYQFARNLVTPQDVYDFCPDDPGFTAYVREFTRLLSNPEPPLICSSAISETIGLTHWTDAKLEPEPERFRRFRVFTNATGLAITLLGDGPREDLTPSYLAASLLDDAYALDDAKLLELLPPVFSALYERLTQHDYFSGETPFILLGQLLLLINQQGAGIEAEHLASRIIREASEVRGKASHEFFWGCSHFDQFNDRWRFLIEQIIPAASENHELLTLRDALLN